MGTLHRTAVVLVLLFAVWVQWGSSMQRNLKGSMGGTNSPLAHGGSTPRGPSAMQQDAYVDPSSYEDKHDDRVEHDDSNHVVIDLTGAVASFCLSTGTTEEQLRVKDVLGSLVETSTKYNGVSAQHVSRDLFLLSPSNAIGEKTAEAWHAVWQSHLAGVAETAPADRNAIFLNWGEPVVDIVLVVVLFNPVNKNLDQRRSDTVGEFWLRVNDAAKTVGASPAVVNALKGRTVFLDLVPVLDDGSGKDALAKRVNDAAMANTYYNYFMARIKGYVTMLKGSRKLEVVFAPGYAKDRNKAASAVPGRKGLEGLSAFVNLTPLTFHPLATKHIPDAKAEVDKALPTVLLNLKNAF